MGNEQMGRAPTEEEEIAMEPEEAVAEKGLFTLTEKSFKNHVAKGDTFIKFYAPWCGHCKKLAPTWVQLADKYASTEGVTIAKVDCTSNDNKNKELCNAQGVNGFPTLNIYKDGEKVDEFNGKRGLDDLAAFVDRTSGKEA